MDILRYRDIIQEGDLVIVYISIRNLYPIVLKHGEVFQNKYGALKHSEVIGKKFGSVVSCSRGWVYVLYPTPELWTITLPHRTQILYSTDISMITFQLDLKPGSIVCEAGTGSGSLSHSLARTVSPNGFLYTFDFHEQRVDVAGKEFEEHGLDKVVKIEHQDVSSNGFNLNHVADAVFLDLPQPWDVIPFVPDAMKLEGGRICSFSPCIEQVQRTCAALKSHNFTDLVTMECLQRQLDVRRVQLPVLKSETPKYYRKKDNSETVDDDVMDIDYPKSESVIPPKSDSVKNFFWTASLPMTAPGHTGYLTFATLLRRNTLKCKEEPL